MKVIFSAMLLALSLNGFSQFYPFDSIPENLKTGANAVVRTSQCLYTVIDPGTSVKKIKKAITLLNEDAESHRYLAVHYNHFSKVNYIRGSVYDEQGEFLHSVGASEIFDMSAVTGGTFYSDDRMKVIRFPVHRFPYTIEYEYEIAYTGNISYPTWAFQDDMNTSVEKSGIQFVIPTGLKFRYLEESLKNKVDSITVGKNIIYTWQESDIPATKWYVRKNFYTSRPVLYISPIEFEYGGRKGSMESWQKFGAWLYEVNKDRDVLPDSEIASVKELVAGYNDPLEKIKAVYEYMQSKTRYVSIQIGIGGLQAAEAALVSQNGFGDCKGLVNYTKALLKAANIDSYFAVVKAGPREEDINTKFVSNDFNHVILCVPLQNDSVWLECTNQNLPFNYLGSFTCDRHALLVTPDGGMLIKTPAFRKEENRIERTGTLFFNIAGTSFSRIQESYSGYFFGDISNEVALESEDELKDALYTSLNYADFSVSSVKYNESKTTEPRAEIQYEVNVKSFGATNGNKIYFAPSISKESFFPEDSVSLRILVSNIEVDSLTYWLPPNYTIDFKPEDITIESEFGKYIYRIETSGEKINLYRRLELEKGFIPASKYHNFRSFYNDIARSDRSIIVIGKPDVLPLSELK